jgi:hypothetical protein
MKVNQFATVPLENVNYAIHNRVDRDVSQLNHAKNNANHMTQLQLINTHATGRKRLQHATNQMLDPTLKKNAMMRAKHPILLNVTSIITNALDAKWVPTRRADSLLTTAKPYSRRVNANQQNFKDSIE